MMDLDSFHKLKKRVESAQQSQDRAIGALSQLTDRLRKEFGVISKEEGLTKLEKWKNKLEKEEKALAKEIETIEQQFKSDWLDKE